MLFNSLEFALFFPIVTILYFLLPHKFRWFHLLLVSCIFYMAFVPVYILILFFTIVIDYYAGIFIENATGKARKRYLAISIVANVGVLVVFKYYNFFIENINTLLYNFHVSSNGFCYLNILLPVGLSFHTFQAMSYTIEIYRGNQKAERHFGIYSLYVMFYPQLVAGPIERPQNILHQFYEKHSFDYSRVIAGLSRMLFGFFKKVVIADRLGLYVDGVYNNLERHNSVSIAIAVVFFAIQIFCDFSGYSDIALGSAKVMGFELMENFKQPFRSKSVTEFWRKWHISLSTWFNDYLFTPFIVKFRELDKMSVVLGLLITFTLSGLWHGAGWNFAIYGIAHGVILVFEFLTKKQRKKLSSKIPNKLFSIVCIFATFIFVSLSWIFFRSPNVSSSFSVIKSLTSLNMGKIDFSTVESFNYFSLFVVLFSIVYMFKIEANEIWQKKPMLFSMMHFSAILALGVFNKTSFIYFQF